MKHLEHIRALVYEGRHSEALRLASDQVALDYVVSFSRSGTCTWPHNGGSSRHRLGATHECGYGWGQGFANRPHVDPFMSDGAWDGWGMGNCVWGSGDYKGRDASNGWGSGDGDRPMSTPPLPRLDSAGGRSGRCPVWEA